MCIRDSCNVDGFGNVTIPAIGFLGTIQDGSLFDKSGNRVGQADGLLWAEAGAALLAINALFPDGAGNLRRPQPFVAQPEPFKVVKTPRTVVYHDHHEPTKPWGPIEFGMAFAAVSMLCMGFMVAAVFVAVMAPIWLASFAAAMIATNLYVKQHILEFADSDFIWADLRGIRAVKRKSVVLGLCVGLLACAPFVFAAKDFTNPLFCLGAVLFALLLMWWFLDRYGLYSIKTHIARLQGSPDASEYGKTNWVLDHSNQVLLGSSGIRCV